MRKSVLAAAWLAGSSLGAVAIGASPAHADWQFTQWGQSPESLLAAGYGLSAASAKEVEANRIGAFQGTPLVKGPYRAAGVDLGAWFYFLNNRLEGIKLTIPDRFAANRARDGLQARYGRPARDEKPDMGDGCANQYVVWVVPAENVQASFSSTACDGGFEAHSILYKPAYGSGDNGL